MFRNYIGVFLIGSLFLVVLLTGSSTAQSDNIVDITMKPEFVSKVIRSRIPVVAFFYSKSECKACNWSLIPSLEKVARNKNSFLLAKINLDEVDLKGQQKIFTIPTTKVYSQGQEVLTPAEGVQWGPIIRLVNQAIKLQ